MSDPTPETPAETGPIRLQKLLARVGVGSRRVVEDMIFDGRIAVNGEVAEMGQKADPLVDVIEIDGALVGTKPDTVWYLLNKPVGIVTTSSDPQGRRTVVDLVPAEPRVFPVGRLDADTEGLLLLTNDGDITHRLTHPSFGVEKEYLAHVAGPVSRGALRKLREGVELDDGMTAPAKASSVAPNIIRLTIHEGRNRQVRRMCEAVGHPVQRLVRVRIGPLTDTSLAPGEQRELTVKERRSIEAAAVPRDAPNSSADDDE